ncbi:MAG TPA: 4-hydroxyphenylpyruvate dioxygenase [Candidatus Kapabacteria bacterium]|nr:4-hydroxyphenylpyruvate dioxygenase [Candidatus Kapabacteria bacterium]
MSTILESAPVKEGIQQQSLPLNGIDYLEFYVGNAKQSAFYYRKAFGFRLVAYAGLETGMRDRASYVLQQGKIRLVLTTPLVPDHPIAQHINFHGDGVKDIALSVDDAESAFRETVKRGARPVQEPTVIQDEFGSVKKASIATYGDTIHTFIERKNYTGVFLPNFKPVKEDTLAAPTGLVAVDHIVGNVGWNEMNTWVEWYSRIMGFHLFVSFDDKDISTEYSALMSKVVANGNEVIKFPINEPAHGKKKSQIEEYIDWYRTPGVQHIALLTGDIIETVGLLKEQGVEFITVPESYYEALGERIGKISEPLSEIRRLNLLIDRDEFGYMLQIFTKPVEDRPTLFFEIIQRRGGRSFGKGNFKALFEAIEREQMLRGNL